VAAELSRYRTVVMSCSACLHLLRAVYPAEGIHLVAEVLHLSEYLEPFLARFSAGASRTPVWYHDPCYLARHEKVIEPPRKLLARVAEVRELAWSREDTECCGGGGLLPKTMPLVADEMARRRLREVAQGGGGTVVTSCGTCRYMLEKNAPPGVKVADLGAFLEERTR
jgi:Fe-S oxidoreductase